MTLWFRHADGAVNYRLWFGGERYAWLEARRRLTEDEEREWLFAARLGGEAAALLWIGDFNRREDVP